MKIILSLVAVLMIGCTPATDKVSGVREGYSYLEVYTDDETGCQYLMPYTSGASMTPRMGADGKQICGTGALLKMWDEFDAIARAGGF